MHTHADKTPDSKKEIANSLVTQRQKAGLRGAYLIDNRPASIAQQKLVQRKENNTGLPDQLKAGVENLSGHSMDNVKVHYNSDKPAQLNAHAYAQGTDIHLASGQEKHLPHEAWHVVQQKQGRVKPTTQLRGSVNVNDNIGLEKEADMMGAKASLPQISKDIQLQSIGISEGRYLKSAVVQRVKGLKVHTLVNINQDEGSWVGSIKEVKENSYSIVPVDVNADFTEIEGENARELEENLVTPLPPEYVNSPSPEEHDKSEDTGSSGDSIVAQQEIVEDILMSKQMEDAYNLLITGEIWAERIGSEAKSLQDLSKNNLARLKEETKGANEADLEFINILKNLKFYLIHDTDDYKMIKESPHGLLSKQELRRKKIDTTHNTPELNETVLANHDFVFFRCSLEEGTNSRFGRQSLVFDPEKIALFQKGWVSLHDMLSPVEGTGENSRLRELKHDGEKFGEGKTYRTSMEADTDPGEELEKAEWKKINDRAEAKEKKREEKAKGKDKDKKSETSAEADTGTDIKPKASFWMKSSDDSDDDDSDDDVVADMSEWRAHPELVNKVGHTYPESGNPEQEKVDLTSEVFFGPDIIEGIALSVYKECRKMGKEFYKIAKKLQGQEAFLKELIAHLYRIEAKIPNSLQISSVPYKVLRRGGPPPKDKKINRIMSDNSN